MKRFFNAISALFVTTTLAMSAQVFADATVQFGVGYRTDDVRNKFTLPDAVRLNSFSQLRFKDLEIFTLGAKLKSTCGDCVYYRADFQYGWILDGDAKERNQLSYKTESAQSRNTQTCNVGPELFNSVRGRNTADFTIAFGYPLPQCFCENLQLVPTIGFAYDTQRIRYKNKDRLSSSLVDDLSLSSCHNSCSSSENDDQLVGDSSSSGGCHRRNQFRSTWWGPFIGFDFAFNCHDCWNVYGEVQFHWSRARKERGSHTNICVIDRHRRSGKAWGYNVKVGSTYFFNCNWFVDGHLNYTRFTSDRNRDRMLWRSLGVGLDLGYLF